MIERGTVRWICLIYYTELTRVSITLNTDLSFKFSASQHYAGKKNLKNAPNLLSLSPLKIPKFEILLPVLIHFCFINWISFTNSKVFTAPIPSHKHFLQEFMCDWWFSSRNQSTKNSIGVYKFGSYHSFFYYFSSVHLLKFF